MSDKKLRAALETIVKLCDKPCKNGVKVRLKTIRNNAKIALKANRK